VRKPSCISSRWFAPRIDGKTYQDIDFRPSGIAARRNPAYADMRVRSCAPWRQPVDAWTASSFTKLHA